MILEPGGSSDFHRHGGEELFFVVKGGPVEVRLHDGGEQVLLKEGDYTHFYSEQSHSAHNPSDHETAEIIVVRFYQHREQDEQKEPLSREEAQEVLRAKLGKEAPGKFDAFERAWLLECIGLLPGRSTAPSINSEGIPEDVLNGLGLARFLRRLRSETGVPNWDPEKVATGEQLIPLGDIKKRAKHLPKLYLPLFYGFLFPSVSNTIVITREGNNGWASLERVEQGITSAGVQHEIPRRTLSYSDLTTTWLTLDPGKVTPGAEHPGGELIIPREGTATIELKDDMKDNSWVKACDATAGNEIAYFRTARPHRICNLTEHTVQMLIVRCYASEAGNVRPNGERKRAPAR